jgi:hypothetical protein
VEIAIRCAMLVTDDENWKIWAENWLSEAAVSESLAWAVEAAARAAARAAEAAATDCM